MSPQITITQTTTLPRDIQGLVDESSDEGFRMIQRLKDDWESESNSFSKSGEAFWEVRHDGKLIGVGGLNQDPYADDSAVARIRRMYVSKSNRLSGAGRLLVERALVHANDRFHTVRVRSTPDATLFYEALGFTRVTQIPNATHEIKIMR